MKKKNHIIKTIFILLCLIITIELLFIAFFTTKKNPQLIELFMNATTIKPEAFTELYFEDHVNLPSEISPKEEHSFKFTIHNLENHDINYTYEVYLDLDNDKLFIDQGDVYIKKGEYKTIQEKFQVGNPVLKTKIIVNLIDYNQQISFWVGGTEQ